MTTPPRAARVDHLFVLDGLRGIAATTVVLYHTSLVFPQGADSIFGFSVRHPSSTLSWVLALPLKIILCGPQAVILFFVLSGFVLARAVTGSRYGSYAAFATKRFFRIWPVFAFVILMSALLSLMIGRHSIVGGSNWLDGIWARGGTKGNIWRHLLMTETRVDLDNAMWSLVHELRISMLIPVIILVVSRYPARALVVAVLLMPMAALASGHFAFSLIIKSYFETLTYIFLFVFGAELSLWMQEKATGSEIPGRLSSFAFATFLILLTMGPEDTAHVSTIADSARLLACGVGATGIVFVALNSRWNIIFASRLARYLGRISYSLYLTHVVILAAVLNATSGWMPLWASTLTALVLIFPLAGLCRKYVEEPTMRAGRRLAERLRHRSGHVPGRIAVA